MNYPAGEKTPASPASKRQGSETVQTKKRPRVLHYNYLPFSTATTINETRANDPKEANVPSLAPSPQTFYSTQDPQFLETSQPNATSVLHEEPSFAPPSTQARRHVNPEPLRPSIQFVSAPCTPDDTPVLDEVSSDVEVIALDDDGTEHVRATASNHAAEVHDPSLMSVQTGTAVNQESEVIDLDDDEALANLQPLHKQHSKLHVSRNGDLFRVQSSGHVEIFDSEDEDELARTHRIINDGDGLQALASNDPATPRQRVLAPMQLMPATHQTSSYSDRRAEFFTPAGAVESTAAPATHRAMQPFPLPPLAHLPSSSVAPHLLRQATDHQAQGIRSSSLVLDSDKHEGSPATQGETSSDAEALGTTVPTSQRHGMITMPNAPSTLNGSYSLGKETPIRPPLPAGLIPFVSSRPMPQWPQQTMNPHSLSLPAFLRLPPSDGVPATAGGLPNFDPGNGTNQQVGLQPSMEHDQYPQALDLQNQTQLYRDPVPFSGTSWLHATHPQALQHAQQRVELARQQSIFQMQQTALSHSQASDLRITPHASTVNPSATGIPPTQVMYSKTAPTSFSKETSEALRNDDNDVVSPERLRSLVKQNSLTADATEEADTPSELNVSLMPHQRRALHWMSKRERPVESDEDVSAVDEQCLGGILADDQGLGKTLTMIALLLKNRPEANTTGHTKSQRSPLSEESIDLEQESDSEDEDNSDFKRGKNEYIPQDRSDDPPWRTLIVCPLSVINQWREEILSRIREEEHPTVCVYHGAKRERRTSVLQTCDVVITTYSTLVNEYPKELKDDPDFKRLKKEKLPLPTRRRGPLCLVEWHRVVLDESQFIKNRGTDSWSAVMSLKSEIRWCLTGTPIQNSVDDIYSLFSFIRYRFVPNYEIWNTRWKKKLEHAIATVRERAFKRFQTIVGVVLLRRTKKDTIDGAPLITLPKRITQVDEPVFCDKEEEDVYRAVQEKSVLTVNKFLVAGTLAHNYSSVLLLLLRLRQACSHPFLIEYAGMQTRARSLTDASQVGPDRYSTTYSRGELEESMELVDGGHSLLSMLDETARKRIQDALVPPAKGMTVATMFSCQYCQRNCPWSFGSFLACGDLFCPDCCQLLRKRRKCLRCLASIEDPDEAEVFINADELRKEVHARTILLMGKTRDDLTMTSAELKSWIQFELLKKKHGAASSTVTPDSTDREVDNIDDDDATLDRLERTIRERKLKESFPGGTGTDCSRTAEKKKRLLRAMSQHSTKIRKIIQKLNEIRERGLNEKTLIFSQWTSMLDIIDFHVQMEGHEVCRLDGSMTLSARQKQIEEFRRNPSKNVFLISIHAGGTGLNLTIASHVIIADVWWNPAVEEQAIDRVHRIGQTRDVTVTRFKMKGTIEERIYAMCAKKREAVDGTLGVTGAQSLGRKKLSLQELMYIFGGAAQDVAQTATRGSAAAEAANNILSFRQHE